MTTKTKLGLPPLKKLTVEEIHKLGLFQPGTNVKTTAEVNGMAVGTPAEVVSVENDGRIYRAKFLAGPKKDNEFRVLTHVLAR
jgi:hypothetical protein